MTTPTPLIPAECRLDKLPFMPLMIDALLESDLLALSTGDEFKAALTLWVRSWKQSPGGSLPDDDRVLAKLAGLTLRQWQKVKGMALRHWTACSDGRLYHPFVARLALQAWIERLRFQKRSAKGNQKRGHNVEPASAFDERIARAITLLRSLDPDAARARENTENDASKEGADAPPSRSAYQPPSRTEKPSEAEAEGEEEVEEEIALLPSAALLGRRETTAALGDEGNSKLDRLCEGYARELWTGRDDGEWTQQIEAWEREGFDFETEILPGARNFFRTHRRRSADTRTAEGRSNDGGAATWAPIRSLAHPGVIEAIQRKAAKRRAKEAA